MQSLHFLTHAQCRIVKTIETGTAKFVSLGNQGKLTVTYPSPFYSYQQGLLLFVPEYVTLEEYSIEPTFLFEKKIVDQTCQITVTAGGHVRRIDKLILNYGSIREGDLMRTEFKVVRNGTDALQLLALVPDGAGKVSIFSFSN